MTFNTFEEMNGLTVLEVLTKLAECSSITTIDEQIARFYAKKLGLPITVTCGIVYIHGEQPIGVNQFFQMLVKMIKKKELTH